MELWSLIRRERLRKVVSSAMPSMSCLYSTCILNVVYCRHGINNGTPQQSAMRMMLHVSALEVKARALKFPLSASCARDTCFFRN
jgi:hypothetical protein